MWIYTYTCIRGVHYNWKCSGHWQNYYFQIDSIFQSTTHYTKPINLSITASKYPAGLTPYLVKKGTYQIPSLIFMGVLNDWFLFRYIRYNFCGKTLILKWEFSFVLSLNTFFPNRYCLADLNRWYSGVESFHLAQSAIIVGVRHSWTEI